MEGTVLLVQEGRFMLVTEHGDSRLFILSWRAASEPQQLSEINRRKVRVTYTKAHDIIGHVAHSVQVLEEAET
ncbi:hypothetical protein [Rhodopila sp.]|jgi:hypothetical protein|uniref:hypothetical protein n=1 Tax=Rhodopila sp. TaxID=2480087 RepID=UPI002B97ABC6|nr:hypothetical protein [Rhodopila sp.]HVZ07512.1 hypothetical protein [Rhodopila sp.]